MTGYAAKRTSSIHLCACGKPAHDQTICPDCTQRTASRLIDTPALLDDLRITRNRQDRILAATDGGKSATIPWPVNLDAGQLVINICALLYQWHATAVHDHGAPLVYRAGPICVILAEHMPKLAGHKDVQELVDDLAHLHREGIKLVEGPENRSRIEVGPCPETISDDTGGADGTGYPCEGTVTAYVPARESTPPRMECSVCHRIWATMEWKRAGQRILNRKATVEAQRDLAREFITGGSIGA